MDPSVSNVAFLLHLCPSVCVGSNKESNWIGCEFKFVTESQIDPQPAPQKQGEFQSVGLALARFNVHYASADPYLDQELAWTDDTKVWKSTISGEILGGLCSERLRYSRRYAGLAPSLKKRILPAFPVPCNMYNIKRKYKVKIRCSGMVGILPYIYRTR